MDWSPEEDKRMLQLRETHTQEETATILTKEFGVLRTRSGVSNRELYLKQKNELPDGTGFKDEIEIMKNGHQRSTKVVELTEAQRKDQMYLLKAHGYDESWEVTSAKSSMWNQHNKQDGTVTLYASSITVKPKPNGDMFERLLDAIHTNTPIIIDREELSVRDKHLLEIPLFDMHFGNSDFEHYKETQERICSLISKRHWSEVLFIIGQDTLHTDNFRGQTTSGTQIGVIDFQKAWNDCRRFFEPLIEKAIKQSKKVKIMYSKGNHDETVSWTFVQLLKVKYPQTIVDDAIIERKAHVFGKIFIGVTHGDKARKNLHHLFPMEYPLEWSRANVREAHIGHLHREDKDEGLMVVRTLATRNKTDQWHRDNGYVGAHKRFMLFEYSEEELESIHYV